MRKLFVAPWLLLAACLCWACADGTDGVRLDGGTNVIDAGPDAESTDYESSPFGAHPASVGLREHPGGPFAHAEDIGVRWARQGFAYWFMIQPDLARSEYDFSYFDAQCRDAPSSVRIVGNITPDLHGRSRSDSPDYFREGSYLPVDETAYVEFVMATVERYDGDGIDDMEGLTNPIQHWQVDSEPRGEFSDFAGLQQMTYEAVKKACGQCTVLIGGAKGFPDNYLGGFDTVMNPILTELSGRYIDVFDFHWYGTATGQYRLRDAVTGGDVYEHVRGALNAAGFPSDLPIWITEMSSYSGHPVFVREPAFPLRDNFPPQSERLQAQDYFKRFIYPLSKGVQKVFVAFGLIEGFGNQDGYWDHTGLIYDGEDSDDLGRGVKKLAYYTYKRMTELLEGAAWSTLTMLRDGGDSDHVYLFRITKDGSPIHIAWWDYFDDEDYVAGQTTTVTLDDLDGAMLSATSVVPSAVNGKTVSDYATAFAVTDYPISEGTVVLTLDTDPVVIEIREP